ncbi:MAG: Unknown protein [uncultured Thiotrichaceae bacterium]|uniref:Lipoprotein n=1 Tax=uncultured Thiotrichaceae bacterium TaxID=298394 RepID=A0A6S6UG94_9GAMM|nr:MAG: Unknown protein [uncultured Thiotrichaceae bacterium]
MKKDNKPARLVFMLSVLLMTGVSGISLSGCTASRDRPPMYKHAYYSPYDYYYYPSIRVYFNVASGYYFYSNGVSWIRTRTLPTQYYLDSRDRVRIVIKSEKPYLWNAQHRVKYQARPVYHYDRSQDLKERRYHGSQHKKSHRR